MKLLQLKTVGVRNLSCPVRLRRKEGGHQHTVATLSMTADLPESQRENCVSTILSVIECFQEDISFAGFAEILDQVTRKLSALSARLEMTFPYFINKSAPVSGVQTRERPGGSRAARRSAPRIGWNQWLSSRRADQSGMLDQSSLM